MGIDRRKGNTQSAQQRRAAIYRRRKETPTRARRGRLEAAKTVLRRSHSDVYEAALDDPRLKGLIRVGVRTYTQRQVLDMAAAILAKEEARNRELRVQYGLAKGKNAGIQR